jgi:hypothetical protein
MNKFTTAIKESKIDIVPKTVINMGSRDGQGSNVNVFEMLMGLLVSDKLGVKLNNEATSTESDKVKSIKESIFKSIEENDKKEKNESNLTQTETMEQAATSMEKN